jgi:enoyl-CoA hydratase/carnithine racemase
MRAGPRRTRAAARANGVGFVYQQIAFEADDGVATITLNRPEKLNAYTVQMGEEVVHAFRRVRDDARLRAVILAGAGRAFCAGVDLDALRAHQAGAAAPGPRLGEEDFLRRLPLELLAYPKPVIAALHGSAIGVGVTMTLPCDLRIAAAGTKLGLTFAKLGLLPGLGSTHLLPRLVGLGKALELVLTARVVGAEEAAAIGLVNRVVPADALAREARETARALAELRPEVLAAAKSALHFGAGASLADAMRHEQQASAALRKR